MADLPALRDAIDSTITAAIPALHGYDTIADAVNLPAFIVIPESAEFAQAMARGTDTWEFNLYVLVSRAEPELGQDSLDEFVTGAGGSSIRQAVFLNKTLGLGDVDAHISRMSGYGGSFESSAVEHIGAILRLIVHTRGTA